MGKNFLIKTSMGKPPNEMGNCPLASPHPGCATDVRHSSCTLLTIWMCHLHSCNSILLSLIHSLDTRQCTPCTFANWRISTELSPIYPLYFRQLADIHWTFANIPAVLSSIGGCPLNFRQYTLWIFETWLNSVNSESLKNPWNPKMY